MSWFGFKGKRQVKKPVKKKKHLKFTPKQESKKHAIERSYKERGYSARKAKAVSIATVRKESKRRG